MHHEPSSAVHLIRRNGQNPNRRHVGVSTIKKDITFPHYLFNGLDFSHLIGYVEQMTRRHVKNRYVLSFILSNNAGEAVKIMAWNEEARRIEELGITLNSVT